MANEMQRGNLTGTAIMRMPISGTVNIGGKQMKELRFMPYSEFPEEGREDVLYIDTDGNAMYYWDGTEYIALSGGGSGGTSNYNELSNKPSINDITLTGNKTSADLGLQPTISDLATIRSGAASGATAVQPSDMETALASKQDVIDDLSDIRTGAAAGETAVQPSALENALSGKQDVISDLADIRSGAAAGATALQPEDVDALPTDGSSNPVSSGGTYNFVNSSIATNTAYFIGTFASVAELEAYSGTVTNNDYAFVTSTDSAGNTLYNRYKYNAATQTWSFEYAVNNTAFTTAQWAAIQSGLTASDKTKLDGIEQGANKTAIDASPTSGSSNAVSSGGVHTALSGKQDTIADLSDIRSGASAGATAVQPSALTDYQTKLSGTNKLDPSYINYDSTHAAVTNSDKTTWNGKQDTISDLSTIRSGAAAGATALQQSDVSSTYSASGTAPVNGIAVNAAIGTLDVSSVGGSGKYISAISETNGKISPTVETMDTTPTSGSEKAVTSGAVYAALASKQDELSQAQLAAANSGITAAKLTADETALGEVINGGAAGTKNLLDCSLQSIKAVTQNPSYGFSWNGNVCTSTRGVSFTINADNSITVAATNMKNDVWFKLTDFMYSAGSYVISGCPTNGSTSSYYIESDALNYRDIGNGVSFTINSTTTDSIYIVVKSGQTFEKTFYPMLCSKVLYDADPSYVPYAPALTNIIITPAAIKAVDEGAKNLLKNALAGTSSTKYAVTATFDANGVGTISGTNNSTTNDSLFAILESLSLPVGHYHASGCPSGGAVGMYRIDFVSSTGSVYRDTGNGVDFDITGNETIMAQFVVYRGKKAPTGTVQPMICTAADWAVSQKFVPYAPTNRELYEMIQMLQNNS